MPEEKDAPIEEPTEETSADTEATDSPQFVNVPGLGEFTPDQIREWHEDSKNKKDWRRSTDERGREINELKRELNEKMSLYDRKINELESRPIPTTPKKTWQEIEDPDERQKVFFETLENEHRQEISGLKTETQKLRETLAMKEEQDKQQKQQEYWTDVIEDTLDKYSTPEDPIARDLVEGYLSKNLFREIQKGNRWTPEMVEKFANDGKKLIDEFGKTKMSSYIDAKKGDNKKKVNRPGEPPAPTKVEFTPDMTQTERLAILEKDPNIPK